MTNHELRRKILQMLYACFTEHPYHRLTPQEFIENLNVTHKVLDFNIIYLEEKGYVELQKPLEGSIFVGARITPKGIDLVENKRKFSELFPTDDT
jgi:DNA-binding MarR family transcriptional regulator